MRSSHDNQTKMTHKGEKLSNRTGTALRRGNLLTDTVPKERNNAQGKHSHEYDVE